MTPNQSGGWSMGHEPKTKMAIRRGGADVKANPYFFQEKGSSRGHLEDGGLKKFGLRWMVKVGMEGEGFILRVY